MCNILSVIKYPGGQLKRTVLAPPKYIVPGTAFAIHRSSSVEFSSSLDIIFTATEGVVVPDA